MIEEFVSLENIPSLEIMMMAIQYGEPRTEKIVIHFIPISHLRIV